MKLFKQLAFAPILLLMGCGSKQAAPPIVAGGVADPAVAQSQQQPVQYATQQQAAQQPQPSMTLPEGTLFQVRLAETLDTKRNRTGDRFRATLDSPITIENGREIIPRGATVTAIHPPEAPNYDVTLWMTAFGTMPRHRVVPPEFDKAPPRYVLAVREPFANPKYRLITELPEGRIYEAVP